MSEISEYLKTQTPDSGALKAFLCTNIHEDSANALNAAMLAGNDDIVVGLLQSKARIESQDTVDINVRKLKGSTSAAFVNYGVNRVSDLPEHLQDAVFAVGASLNLCEYSDEEQKNKLFDSLDRSHAQESIENENNIQRLKNSGELAPSMTMTPDL
jgi:hypothetical protein